MVEFRCLVAAYYMRVYECHQLLDKKLLIIPSNINQWYIKDRMKSHGVLREVIEY